MQYPSRVNYKGLLAIRRDKTVHHRKLGYFAVQHLTALFDGTIQRVRDFHAEVTGGAAESTFAAFGYRGPHGGPLLTVWRSSDTPGKRPELEYVTLAADGLRFTRPVWADLLTGRVYLIEGSGWAATERGTTFVKLPVYDSPVVIAERKEIERPRPSSP